MSSINIKKQDITSMHVDAIVNAANAQLQAGGGVCGAIFRKAGYAPLQAACDAYGGCKTGDAVITPGFALPAKYVIHAVGPIWRGGGNGEPKDLYDCYRNSLLRAMENDCHSIAFPLISSGIYGYPKEDAWEEAIISCSDFLEMYEEYDMDIFFCVIDDIGLAMGNKIMERMLGDDEEETVESAKVIENPFGTPGENNPYTDGCPELERALRIWCENDFEEDPSEVLDTLFEELQKGFNVIVPIKYENQGTDEEDMLFQIIETDDDVKLLACFTNNKEKNKGESSSSTVIPMVELMHRAIEIDGCDGIAINPWGDGILVPIEIIKAMVNDLEPKSQDQMDAMAGEELYHRGEYSEAVRLLQQAASANNINAIGRLGNCFYHGLGVEMDFDKARMCWEKAALLNDINATIRIADLYRTGELPQDEEFAKALYSKAFMMACDNKTLWSFPEAAHRMLVFCQEVIDDDDLEAIAMDAAGALEERMTNFGDNQAMSMLVDLKEFID